MDTLLILIITIITVFSALAIVTIYIYNKFQLTNIKLDEASNNIDILLEKKLNYLQRLIPVIKDNIKDDIKDLEKVLLLKSKKLNNFELNIELNKNLREFYEIFDTHPNLSNVKNFMDIKEEMEDNEEELEATKRYFNDNVTITNKLIKCFPSNIVAKLFRYKQKSFYANGEISNLEILKENK